MAMSSQLEEAAVEVVRAESARFRHPLLMIHGLWAGGWLWRGLAGYLAHRGWDAWLPSSRGADPERRCADLIALARGLESPPILIGHDAGLATAIAVADATAAPAIVAIAPIVAPVFGGSGGVLRGSAAWVARLGARVVAPPRGGAAATYFAGLDAETTGRFVPDAGAFYRSAFAAVESPLRGPRPRLVVASSGDLVTTSSAAKRFASRVGFAFDLHESAGHFPMLEPGFERLGDRMHRWLIRTLGEHLLLFLDDDDRSD